MGRQGHGVEPEPVRHLPQGSARRGEHQHVVATGHRLPGELEGAELAAADLHVVHVHDDSHGVAPTGLPDRSRRAGTPAHVSPSGTSVSTTAPMPTTAPAPIRTPGCTEAFMPR